jgi:hypothetical protein
MQDINQLSVVTKEVAGAAREPLVIGVPCSPLLDVTTR